MRLHRSAALAAAVFAVCAGVAAAPEYVTYDVHPAGSDSSQIFGMNTVGEAVGAITRNGVTRAAYWAGPEAAPVELDGLGDTLTRAFDINGAGEIVGIGTTGGAFRAIYWRRFDAAPVQLADLGSGARANAINDRGEVVGNVAVGVASNRGRIIDTLIDSEGLSQPVFWSDPTAQPHLLTGVNPRSSPTGINDRGHIVGRNMVALGIVEPVFWQWSPADGDYRPAVGLGSLAADGRGEPVEISDVGEIVGWSGPDSVARAPYRPGPRMPRSG